MNRLSYLWVAWVLLCFVGCGKNWSAKALQKSWADHLGTPVQITNSIGMKLNLIPPGEFVTGSPKSDLDAWGNELPQHLVKITKPFYLSAHEVTQAQYEQVMGKNPSYFSASGNGKGRVSGDTTQFPVEQVSWNDAVEFCSKLSEQEGDQYRLPTEAEWEYACRAGTTTVYSCGNDAAQFPVQLGEHAWYGANSKGTTHPVGELKPNAWDLYDMQGNVVEWCQDWYGDYDLQVVSDPTGPASGEYRVLRGGGFGNIPGFVRTAFRLFNALPDYRVRHVGFRLAMTIPLSP